MSLSLSKNKLLLRCCKNFKLLTNPCVFNGVREGFAKFSLTVVSSAIKSFSSPCRNLFAIHYLRL